MKKFAKTTKMYGGGVLALSAIFALSLTFASCANSSDSDDENPSPSLPENVGENPIKETVKLRRDGYDDSYLELKTDGTALAIYVDDDKSNVEEPVSKYKYTYDDEKRTITMILEKTILDLDFEGNQEQLMTYSEICSKINEEITVEKMRQSEKEYYEERKDGEWFKEDYPDCDTYEKYEAAIVKMEGFDSYDDLVKSYKQEYENVYKAAFGAQITYSYKKTGSKITLTEKFTGVKNMLSSECEYSDYDGGQNYTDVYIASSYASIRIYEDDVRYRYNGTVDTDKKTISFESKGGKEKVTATYTENINAETVTIKFKDKEYVCKFEGQKFVQE